MAREILKSGNVVLPAPVSVSVNDELIWTSETGRVMSGEMIGTVVAEKKTISLKWGVLRESEMNLIKSKLCTGFFPFTFRDDGAMLTITAYRGTLSKEQLGWLGDGIFYYKSASVDVVQR